MGSSFFGKSFQSRYQATGRRGDLIFLDGYGQTIGTLMRVRGIATSMFAIAQPHGCQSSMLDLSHRSPSPPSIPRERILRKRGLACSGTIYHTRFLVGDAE